MKAESHKADTHALEESDRAILSINQPNKEERSSAEAGKKRARPKENITQSNMSPTQSGEQVSQGPRGGNSVRVYGNRGREPDVKSCIQVRARPTLPRPITELST